MGSHFTAQRRKGKPPDSSTPGNAAYYWYPDCVIELLLCSATAGIFQLMVKVLVVAKRPVPDSDEFSPNRPLIWSSHPKAAIEAGELNFLGLRSASKR
jgi:hypothetical protein